MLESVTQREKENKKRYGQKAKEKVQSVSYIVHSIM